ncbi:MAG: arylesterase [Armatimonadetes bacterium]|nr:arylesterase [Armatimonadota bacterium]
MVSRRLGGAGLVLLVLWLSGCSHAPVRYLKPAPGPVVILGDSLAAGVGAPEGRGFVGQLEERLQIEIVNQGVPGDTTARALERLEEDVLELEPSLVIVELGGNDFLQKVPPEETFANLENIIGQIHELETPVLLLGVQAGVFSDKHGERYEELARRLEVAYVPNILEGILASPALKYDGIHPNEEGYRKLADKIEPVLRRLLGEMERI